MGVTWIIVGILGILGIFFIGYGLRLQLVVHKSKTREELEKHLEILNLNLKNRQQVRNQIAQHKERFQAVHFGATPTAEDEEVGWCLEDYDWRLDDLDWTIDDIKWDIRDTQFEMDSRQNVESTSRSTFWTVLGAAVFSLAGLILGIVAML